MILLLLKSMFSAIILVPKDPLIRRNLQNTETFNYNPHRFISEPPKGGLDWKPGSRGFM